MYIKNDRENLINEIISEINTIINKTKKNDIIEKEEKKDSIIDEDEEIYKEIQKNSISTFHLTELKNIRQ